MRWEIENCPKCGGEVVGTLEKLNGMATVSRVDETSEFEWTGYTEVFWDDQCTVMKGDREILICEEWHTWASKKLEPKGRGKNDISKRA